MAGRKVNITQVQLEKALEVRQEFQVWKIDIETKLTQDSSINERMKYVAIGVQMGINLSTALSLCAVTELDFKGWVGKAENMRKLQRAIAFADAQLEYVVHRMAQIDPYFALNVLTKKNPKRWDTVEAGAFEKGVNTGLKMSQMLKTLSNGESFDVTN